MYGYAGQSASAAQVTPFATPAATTNPGGTATQAAAVSQATGTSAASSSQSILQQLTSSMPNSLQSLASPAATSAATTTTPLQTLYALIFGTTVLPTNLSALVTNYSPYASLFYNTEGLPYFSVGMGNFGVQIAKSAGMLGGAAPAAAAPALGGLGGLGGALGGGGAAGAGAGAHAISAISGGAGSVGKLAVPASWVGGAAAQAAPHGVQLVSSVSAAPEAAAGSGNLMGGMPLAGTRAGFGNGLGPRYGFKPTVMPRPPSAG